MFNTAYNVFRNSVYVIFTVSTTNVGSRFDWGTGFFVSERNIVSVAHVCYDDGDITTPLKQQFFILELNPNGSVVFTSIRLISHDTTLDIAVFETERAYPFVSRSRLNIGIGSSVCSFGFHYLTYDPIKKHFEHFFPKMKSGVISSDVIPLNYVVDTIMYKGSSGCPIFDVNGDVVGMQCRNLIDPTTGVFLDFSMALRNDEISRYLINIGINF